MHCHDFYELELTVEGRGTTILNGNRYDMACGLATFLSPEDFHEHRIDEELCLYNIQFTPDSIDSEILDRLSVPGDKIGSIEPHELSRVVSLIEIMANCDTASETQRKCQAKLLEAILLLISDSLTGEKRHHCSPPLQKALVYIHAHFKENPPLAQIAGVLYLNERYFCTAFGRHVGMSYKAYLRHIKLGYAARLMSSTDLTVTEVAAESGYSSLSHFNREFKAFFGLSPLNMRKKNQEQPDCKSASD